MMEEARSKNKKSGTNKEVVRWNSVWSALAIMCYVLSVMGMVVNGGVEAL